MPAPAVAYVTIAVGVIATVAAGIAFKEFIYEPHIAPKVEAWAESFVENRRRTRARRQGPVLAQLFPTNTDENQARKDNKKRDDSDSDDDDPMSVELQDLVTREVNDWRSEVHQQSTIRNRKTPVVIDEGNADIPYNPMTPSQVIFDASSAGPSQPRSSPVQSQHRSPSVQSRPSSRHSSRSLTPHSPFSNQHSQRIPSVKSPVPLSPRLPTPISNVSPTSTRATSPANSHLDHSVSSMSSFAPAVVGPRSSESIYGSPRSQPADALSDAGRSGLNVLSVPTSRIASPFSDVHSVSATQRTHSSFASPLVLSPTPDSDFDFPDTSDGMLSPSLRSGMFSPSLDHDDPFEVGSEHESEFSWDSMGRRTPEA